MCLHVLSSFQRTGLRSRSPPTLFPSGEPSYTTEGYRPCQPPYRRGVIFRERRVRCRRHRLPQTTHRSRWFRTLLGRLGVRGEGSAAGKCRRRVTLVRPIYATASKAVNPAAAGSGLTRSAGARHRPSTHYRVPHDRRQPHLYRPDERRARGSPQSPSTGARTRSRNARRPTSTTYSPGVVRCHCVFVSRSPSSFTPPCLIFRAASLPDAA